MHMRNAFILRRRNSASEFILLGLHMLCVGCRWPWRAIPSLAEAVVVVVHSCYRHDVHFRETVDVSIGADACYLHVRPPALHCSYCFIFRAHLIIDALPMLARLLAHPLRFHVMCAANRHSEALPYVAFLDSWIADRPGFSGQVRLCAGLCHQVASDRERGRACRSCSCF